VSQDPAGASAVDKDDAMVNLVISQGPPPNGVRLAPSFSGKTVSDATQWAQQNGLLVTVRDEPGHTGTPGIIYRQDPAPTPIARGSRNSSFLRLAERARRRPSPWKVFYYEIPQGGDSRSMRLVLRDDSGETEIFSGVKQPGSKLSIPINPQGRSRVRVFMNNILIEEQEVK